ncbi:hypothetical protein ACQP1O_43235 (plasmid) [Nocardia sp. CA-151230]|uniref:hypothetical protein n=1 Tax=Nocardia sp. CA-151230 TaxID=3239982 RepID=UPI003D8DF190
MVERKTAARPQVADKVEKAPIGRFYDLQQEIDVPKPYVLTEDITISPLTRRQFIEIETAENETAAERIIFGEQYDAVIALFEDQPYAVWHAFTRDINRHLFGLGVEQAPGKSEESSDS